MMNKADLRRKRRRQWSLNCRNIVRANRCGFRYRNAFRFPRRHNDHDLAYGG